MQLYRKLYVPSGMYTKAKHAQPVIMKDINWEDLLPILSIIKYVAKNAGISIKDVIIKLRQIFPDNATEFKDKP